MRKKTPRPPLPSCRGVVVAPASAITGRNRQERLRRHVGRLRSPCDPVIWRWPSEGRALGRHIHEDASRERSIAMGVPLGKEERDRPLWWRNGSFRPRWRAVLKTGVISSLALIAVLLFLSSAAPQAPDRSKPASTDLAS